MSATVTRPGTPPTTDPSPTPTLTPAPEITAVKAEADDAEKQSPAAPMIPGGPFPDGGLRAWATVVGAWLASKSSLFLFFARMIC
jgi:hypothetical protein